MEIVMFRHGCTQYNLEERYQGHNDLPLNEVGKVQAKKIATHLSCINWDLIVVSPQRRAQETVAQLARVIAAQYVVMNSFRERNLGAADGHLKEELERRHPGFRTRLNNPCFRPPPDGESITDVANRISHSIKHILGQYDSPRRTLIVTHGGVINSLRYFLETNTKYNGTSVQTGNGVRLCIDKRYLDQFDMEHISIDGWDLSPSQCRVLLEQE